MRSLSGEEIEEVQEILYERHPMYYDKAALHDVFPVLKVSRFTHALEI